MYVYMFMQVSTYLCVCVATVTYSTNVTQKENGVSCGSILSKISTYNLTATKQNLSAIAPLNTQ